MSAISRIAGLVLPAVGVLLAAPAYADPRARSAEEFLAFPGATGFGRLASGGRGGDVYTVTSLADSGEGTLRDALETARRARTIVFAVSGEIWLESPLLIGANNLTIAGQTAPEGGITLAGYPVTIEARNVILRHLRFRMGDFHMAEGNGKSAKGRGDVRGHVSGALDVVGSSNVILDHLSVSWGIDETLSVTYSNNITVQHSIISESLHDSNHQKGPHGYGSLLRGNGEGGTTFYRNLYAHHDMRNPGAGSNQAAPGIKGQLDFTNNVVYGWGTRAGEAISGTAGGVVELNYVGNYVIANPDARNPAAIWDEEKTLGILTYQTDNLLDPALEGPIAATDHGWDAFPNFTGDQKLEQRWPFPSGEILPASAVLEAVLADAGASLYRDAVDLRVLDQLRGRTGRIINSQDDVGGLPAVPAKTGPVDSDGDGMPDAWELANGLDPANPDDRNGVTLDGKYTNLEVYLESLIRR